MENHVEYLLKVLDCYIWDKPVVLPPKDIDWDQFAKAAGAGEVLLQIYKKLNELPEEHKPPVQLMEELRGVSTYKGLKKIEQYSFFSKILQEAKKREIAVVLFKGPILADLYPEPFLRNSSDMDVYVSPEQLPMFERLLLEMGMIKNEKHSKEMVPVYYIPKFFMIEAHCCLYEDYQGKRVQLLKQMALEAEEKRVEMDVCGLHITTLGYEEHLIFLMFHLIKHISYSGCSLKTIIDLVLYINRYIECIDLQHFWKVMKQLKYDVFCRTLFSVGVYYFHLTQEIFIDDSYSEHMAVQTLERMYHTGIIMSDMEHIEEDRRASSIAFQSVYDHEKKVCKMKMLRKACFPSSKDLSFRYMYARKYPVLIGFAWMHRAMNYTIFMLMGKKEKANMRGDMQLANRKVSLLRDLDLLNKD